MQTISNIQNVANVYQVLTVDGMRRPPVGYTHRVVHHYEANLGLGAENVGFYKSRRAAEKAAARLNAARGSTPTA